MSFKIDRTLTLGDGDFRLEFGTRSPNQKDGKDWAPGARVPTAPCVWLIKERTGQEMARVDRCWATGEKQFHFLGGIFRSEKEFKDYTDALSILAEAAGSLPENPKS